jgi:DNA-binding Lrp family transcriptional regulator
MIKLKMVNLPLDLTDSKIITLLNQDGRMSSAEIARRIGDISPRTVNYRIESLVERGVISVRAIVNPKMLGYVVLADVLIGWLVPARIARCRFVRPGQLRGRGDRRCDLSIQVVARTNEEYSICHRDRDDPGVRRTRRTFCRSS